MSNKEDKMYGVRISFSFGNPITLELKGSGRAQILPDKDYFFENAPIEFINYLAQLKGFGVSYKITADKKGCYNVFDLRNYNQLPRVDMLRNYRAPSTLKEIELVQKEAPKEVTAKQEDIIKVEPVKVEEPEVKDLTEDEVKAVDEAIEEITKEPEVVEDSTEEPEVEAPVEDVPTEDEPVEEPHVYTEDELKDLTKKDLLAIAEKLDLSVSDINTKKEIRAAILSLNK